MAGDQNSGSALKTRRLGISEQIVRFKSNPFGRENVIISPATGFSDDKDVTYFSNELGKKSLNVA